MIISLIVSTYNRPSALKLVLQSLECQTDQNFEIIVADDGSTQETRSLVDSFRIKLATEIKHVWHEDRGFRLSEIRNLAISQSSGDYLIFLDGDCIAQPDFVAQHRRLAGAGKMVTGGRVLLGERFTEEIISVSSWNYSQFRRRLLRLRLTGQCNKVLPMYLKFCDSSLRNYRGFVWRRIKGCNLACWRDDAVRVGGFDEKITGWGHEDADFVFRLYDSGIERKSGSWATEVLHLYHPVPDKRRADKNEKLVRDRISARVNRVG